jgi:hypothetical protein
MSFSQEAAFELDKFLAPSVKPEITRRIRKTFQREKNKMIAEFLNHPVTVEIQAGIASENISQTLAGITNLFSFIGFEQGYDPISPITEFLQTSVQINFVRTTGRSIIYRIEIPEASDIFEITPMPWASGRSWAKGVETGISGLGYYLKVEANSRSGLGIQTQNQVRKKVKFQNVPYISSLIKKYQKQFKNLKI